MAWRRWRAGRPTPRVLHLLHAESGRYNDPYVRHLLAGEPVVLVHLWQREVGLVVPRGNPLAVRGVADLAGRRVAWRARGSGSRLLLERLLAEAGVEAAPESGEPADSHFAVAAAVAAGAADAGLAVRAVARACDLDFVGVTVEPFELARARGRRSTTRPGCSRACTTRPSRRRSPRSAAMT